MYIPKKGKEFQPETSFHRHRLRSCRTHILLYQQLIDSVGNFPYVTTKKMLEMEAVCSRSLDPAASLSNALQSNKCEQKLKIKEVQRLLGSIFLSVPRP